MDSKYIPKDHETKTYLLWEKSGLFNPDNLPNAKNRKPYTILLPPPNASGKMHIGNVLMIAIEDLLIRWKRMSGFKTLWLPGTDHAGFETQITYERELRKQGLSRFSFDRSSFYKNIEQFVLHNKSTIENQIKSMGASVDWSRYRFTLDDSVLKTVWTTFQKLYKDGLIYRDDYIVNYCPKCGTTFADLEVKYIERKDPVYYITYGPFTVATVRPETKFGDTALAVHPKDPRYKKFIGENVKVVDVLGPITLPVIADSYVDPAFGTGVVKVTPAHDKKDFEAGLRHNLSIKTVIGPNGKLNSLCGPYADMSVLQARTRVVSDLENMGLLVKTDSSYTHSVAVCYKGNHDIEPSMMPNWFVKVDDVRKSLKRPATSEVVKKRITIVPKWREKIYLNWMKEMRDWPISRQVVWGIRIPVWYSVSENPSMRVEFIQKKKTYSGTILELLKSFSFTDIKKGLQKVSTVKNAKFIISVDEPKKGMWLPETDTFDTWFSSGQWPLVTLGYPHSSDFRNYYPTAVLETGWEIIRPWVSRMVMLGLYISGKKPFKTVYLHGIVRAPDGKKMSKSLGNIINPEQFQQLYGTDALRLGLISGTATGHDFNFPQDRIVSYQKFTNKLWNIARFIKMQNENFSIEQLNLNKETMSKHNKTMLAKLDKLVQSTNINLEKFRFAQGAEALYHFIWHELADIYIEHVKTELRKDQLPVQTESIIVLNHLYITCLKLLHPFMPFITETIWQEFSKEIKGNEDLLMIQKYPK